MNIVAIHRGWGGGVDVAMAQARRRNADVHLVSDSPKGCPALVHDMRHFMDGVDDFRRIYDHRGANGYEYELFCFQRWFILRNFMRKTSMSKCMYIDSDVMVYGDMSAETRRFDGFDFTLSKGHCGQNSVWNSLAAVDALCEMTSRIFRDKDADWKWMMERMSAVGAPVCDMTALELFRLRGGFKCGETTDIVCGSTFDHNINLPQQTMSSYLDVYRGHTMQEWEMSGDIKSVHWVGADPYGRLNEQPVRFNSLHFSGGAKGRMSEFLR